MGGEIVGVADVGDGGAGGDQFGQKRCGDDPAAENDCGVAGYCRGPVSGVVAGGGFAVDAGVAGWFFGCGGLVGRCLNRGVRARTVFALVVACVGGGSG